MTQSVLFYRLKIHMSDLHDILIDIETLARSTREDYSAKMWTNWPEYIEEFNRILSKTKKLGYDFDISQASNIPSGQLASHNRRAGTGAVIAKVKELADKSERLRLKIAAVIKEVPTSAVDHMSHIEKICTRFHKVAKSLRSRRQDRPTLEIEDEYDVQDLMSALLCMFFEDIRREEWTPSYAGGSARMDFLLKPEQVVIEVKKTRKGLADKEIGEQLIVDIEKYSQHQDCKTLICFIYDPEGRIANPKGLETDLMKMSTSEPEVSAFIRPLT